MKNKMLGPKRSITDKIFSLSTALKVPYINLNNCHIRFWRRFDNIRVRHENNVIENVDRLKNPFNDV